MQLYNLSRATEGIIGGVIEGRDDMQFLQTWCEGKGYACHVNLDQSGIWSGNITTPNGQSIPMQIGWWAILRNGVDLNIFTPEQGAALFNVGTPIQ